MAPRWSILLPTHDRAEVVGYAIRSVLAQTDADFELLVVGDGCTDDTATVVTSFADERIRWYDLPKAPGFGYANRNVALRDARGELVAFMAHDDLLFPDHLERMAPLFARDQVEWAYSRPLWIEDDGTIVPFAVDLRRPAEFHGFMRKGNKVPASCVVHRRTCLERYGYWSETRMKAGDWELWTRMVGPARGSNIDYEPAPTCLHFRAAWKTGPTFGPTPLSSWLRVARDGWWPTALRLEVPVGTLPQAHVWERMEREGSAWLERCRDAVVSVVDGFAWEQAIEMPRLERKLAEGGWALVRGGRLEEATDLADAGLEVAPASAQLHLVRATAWLGRGDAGMAEAAGRRALELDRTLVRGYRVLARALAEQGRLGEAIEVAGDGVAVDPENAGLLTQLGGLLVRAGDLEAADDAAGKAERLAPSARATRKLRDDISRARERRL